MKLAFLSHTSLLAGAERMLLNLSIKLMGFEGIEIIILAYGEGELKEQSEKHGIRYIQLENHLPWYLFVKDEINELTNHWQAVNKSKEELKKIYLEFGIEYVVINTLTNLPGLIAANEMNIPSILWIHGIIDNMVIPNGQSDFKIACDRIMINAATSVVCPSDWVKNHYKYYREDITVIPNFTFVPERILPFPASEVTIFSCFNTWNSLKGIEHLIEAASILNEQGEKFLLNCYGSGDELESLKELISTKGLEDVVRLNSRVLNISDVYLHTHTLITASLLESFGMTLIEAMAHGRPIIASNTGGHLEIVENRINGFFAETANPYSFAERMKWIIDNTDKAKTIGENGYLTAKDKFDGKASTKIFLNILNKDSSQLFNQKIYTDLIVHILHSLLHNTTIDIPKDIEVLGEQYVQVGEPLAPVRIRSKRRYKINCSFDSLTQIDFLIGTHDKNVTGTLRLKIMVNEIILRETHRDLREVADNSWVSFQFDKVNHLLNKEVTLILSLESNDELSVYEAFDIKSTRLGNISNKLRATGFLCCKLYF